MTSKPAWLLRFRSTKTEIQKGSGGIKKISVIAILFFFFTINLSIAVTDIGCSWTRVQELPDYLNLLNLEKGSRGFSGINLTLERVVDNPFQSCCLFFERLFVVRKDKDFFPWEDIIMRYAFERPTTKNTNHYHLIEVVWFSSFGDKLFWNKSKAGKPYKIFSPKVPCGSLQ